ncbi:MAG: BON domain-containing protein [Pirellulales bacterium]
MDLERRIVSYLVGRHVPSLRHISVEAVDGTVTLRGQVRSFYEKQLCHNCCRRVAGVIRLVDSLDVAVVESGELATA